ncbi:SusC/RagA family TonB-linked outer membrane protein [Alistipes communis]|jgi:TonB-linked SusC/RagA family outer membrane protein|uniref:SusC/RagA family TonB-linked outer membrane protein n=1 Tax=Alistipes communis TaxID=2585118 RepID=UPI002591FFA1|nr:TonB-dependent receptor [uncultured Alistipes sp.]
MKKYGFLTLILCLFCLGEAAVASPGKADAEPAAQAQSSKLTVKGFVKDDKGDPMIGVTLIVKGTNFGTVSNADGSYSIDVPYGGATLMVSYIGYAPQEINVNNRTKIDITLLEDSKALEEVVVVGYNVQKKETITGSIATITTKDLKQSPTANINNALAGRMPGLLVNQFSGGEPGNDAAQLNIRGISTYGQSGVIMIVDGIERDMSYLAPDEIETFTILKDASATAPYGIRGANGVIVVTTKRGRKGEKPTVDFKASVGISEPIRYPDYLGSADYATLYNEAMLHDNPSWTADAPSLFTQEAIDNYRRAKGDNSDGLGYNWDYFDYAFQPSVLQDYSLSVRGGTDRARYFILGSYYKQGGNYKLSNADNANNFLRYNFRANVDVDATKRLKISVDLGARVTEYSYPGATAANIISLANTQPPYLPIVLPNNGNEVNQTNFEENGGYLLYGDVDYRYNMLGQLTRTGFSKRTRRYLQGSFKLSHDLDFITKGLSVAAQFSYDTFNQHTIANNVATFGIGNLTYPGYSIWSLANNSKDEWKNNAGYWIQNGSYTNANQRTTDDAPKNTVSHGKPEGTSRFQARLDYNRKFGDHNVTAMLLYYMQNKIVNNEVPFRYMGMSARATYDYKNKYLFEFNLGYNGSENFARGHRFGVFPAGSIGWVVSQEEFMKNVSWIDHLKLRASFGLVGNDQMPDNLRFAYLQYYSSDDNMNIYFGENRKPYGTTLIEGVFANPSLTWEKARKFNFGIDAEFFHQRLTLSVDVFKEHRYDILTSLEDDNKLGFPYIVGQTAPIVNSGIVDNRGIEFQLSWDGRIGQHFRYWIRPNFTFARNKVKFCNEISYIDNNGRDCPWRYQTGRRVGENFCYIFDHFVADQDEADRLNAMNGGSGFGMWGAVQPGDVVYKDMNGDGVVNNYDRAAIGNPRTPEIQYGIPVGLSYKGFDFSMLWQGSALCSVQLSGPAVWDFPLYDQSRIGKVRRMHLNRWTPETAATATYPALHYGIHNNNKQQYSSLFLYDATYIRLKNVEIGYTLPKAWTSKAGIQSVRIYAQGQNLLTFDRLGDVDMDPEIKNGDGSWFPVQRVVNLGINMTF